MNEEERKAWEMMVDSRKDPRIVQLSKGDLAILAADAELVALREENRRLREAVNKVIRNANSIETKIEFGSGRTTIVCANFIWDELEAALRAYDR